MCMMLFIGSKNPLPLIGFDEGIPAFHTKHLDKSELAAKQHFSVNYILYAGSSEGCGCGFKHALIDKKDVWLNVVNDDLTDESRLNQQALLNYIKRFTQTEDLIEIFACWDGDFACPSEWKERITKETLVHENFYFKERGFYTIY